MECLPALPDVARLLEKHFDHPPGGFEDGRQALIAALLEELGCTDREAAQLFAELEREGYLRYAAEGRSIGGSPGSWIVYIRPENNPEEAADDDAAMDAATPDPSETRSVDR